MSWILGPVFGVCFYKIHFFCNCCHYQLPLYGIVYYESKLPVKQAEMVVSKFLNQDTSLILSCRM